MSILVATRSNPDIWVSQMKKYFPERTIVTLEEPFDRRSVHYVLSWYHPEGSLTGLPNLTAIFSIGAGVDHLFRDTRLPEALIIRAINENLTNRMSEYVLLHCLSYLRQSDYLADCQKQKLWMNNPSAPSAQDIRIGIMGYGVLGQDAGRKLQMVGFDVAGWVRTPHETEDISLFTGEQELEAFLNRTDILVCLLPLTDETRGILNLKLFEKLPQDGVLGGPYLINAGRGECQIEEDIIAALDQNILKGATLDVFQKEPLPPESPLWQHPGIILTPHNAAISNSRHIAKGIAEAINMLEKGDIPPGIVSREQQY